MTRIAFDQLPGEMQDQVKGMFGLTEDEIAGKKPKATTGKKKSNPGNEQVGFVDLVKSIGMVLVAMILCLGAVVFFVWLCASIAGGLG